MREFPSGRIRTAHPHAWLWEPLEEEATFVLRSMFGAKAAYLDGRLALCFIAKQEPWRGLLVCTERRHHPALAAAFPGLAPHEVLGKWLYLSEDDPDFDRTAERIVRRVLRRDPRIGVVPAEKKKKKRAR